METSGLKDWWKSETDQDEKGETRRRIYYWDGVLSRRMRSWGRMWTDLDIGPVTRGIRRWRSRVSYPRREKCRVYHVEARIP